jgi:hypothetical protein
MHFFELLSKIFFIGLILLEGIQHYIPTLHFSYNLFWELNEASIMLFMPTNVTP